MNKKILIGSIFVLILLFLMPSIPATQHKVVKDKITDDLLQRLDFKNIKELQNIDLIRHPLFYTLVIFIAKFRFERCLIISEISCDFSNFPPEFEIYHPILYFRGLWLVLTIAFWCTLWDNISDSLRWNWEDIIEHL